MLFHPSDLVRDLLVLLAHRVVRVVNGRAKLQPDPPCGQAVGNLARVGNRARQPVELGHHQRVARTQELQQDVQLGPALAAEGLILRNLDRRVGDIAIQDLLTEELFETLFPLLRLAASGRNPEAWTDSQERLRVLFGLSDEDDAALGRLQRDTGAFVRELRAYMDDHPPAEATATEVLNLALAYVGRERLVGAFANYQRPADFERVFQGFLILITECTAGQAQWRDVLDRFEGLGQVPLMTIHKSKGLEFHTMIFFGLDNRTWWSLKNDGGEEMNSFFVALTRAQQRAYFSFCRERGRAFAWLEELLEPVGVRRIDGVAI